MSKDLLPVPDVFIAACPSRAVLAKIANKWCMLVVDALADGPCRTGILLRRIEGISQKMLTATLRDMSSMGLVLRDAKGTIPPHVEYRLTHLGESLRSMVCELDRWIEDNLPALQTRDL